MCFVITIAVPAGEADAIRAAFAAPGLDIEPTPNPSAHAAAGPGRVPLLITGGGCSCAWYRRPPDDDARTQRLLKRAAKEGWSRAKTERALAPASRVKDASVGLHPVIVELLRAVVGRHGPVAVWVHDFHGRFDTEAYECPRTETASPVTLAGVSARTGPDTIIEIAPG
ncbi:MAG: hypothetical protein HRU70_03890 [Phycisphaeraceae bacterium]|nr:MAG: hypothetical protein HRU70_03890 [Phycisphaeraceae bacterium]